MNPYCSNSTIAELTGLLRSANRIGVVSHDRPDGDAMGTALMVVRACRALGKQADMLLTPGASPTVVALAAAGECRSVPPLPAAGDYDLAVVVDTGARSQLEGVASWLQAMSESSIGLDHHARGEEVARHRVVEVGCASASQVTAALIDALGVAWTSGAGPGFTIADACFAGLATDTGWFRFASADAAVMALASRLLTQGADKERVHALMEESERPQRMGILARALSSLSFLGDGEAAIMRVGHADFAATGANSNDLGGAVNEPLCVGSVRVAMLLTETEPGITKISFRCKGPQAGCITHDMNEFAARFGGGGHVQAAGARLKQPLDAATAEVTRQFADYLARRQGKGGS